MKFETLILRSLFLACMLVCGLVFGAMLTAKPSIVQLATNHGVRAILPTALSGCALPPDGVLCPQPQRG